MPQTTQALEIHRADMVKDKTIEMNLLDLWLVITHSRLHVILVLVADHLAVIKTEAAEDMVVDKILTLEAVVVAEHLTLKELLLMPEIQTFHVMDVARIIMSCPVQPLHQNENRLCYNKTGQGHQIGHLQHVLHIIRDKAPMV
jgi:hypothetical protein